MPEVRGMEQSHMHHYSRAVSIAYAFSIRGYARDRESVPLYTSWALLEVENYSRLTQEWRMLVLPLLALQVLEPSNVASRQ